MNKPPETKFKGTGETHALERKGEYAPEDHCVRMRCGQVLPGKCFIKKGDVTCPRCLAISPALEFALMEYAKINGWKFEFFFLEMDHLLVVKPYCKYKGPLTKPWATFTNSPYRPESVIVDIDFCQSLPIEDEAEFGYQLMHRVGGRSVVDKRGNEYLNYTKIARGMTIDLFLEIYYETQGGI